MGGCEGGEQGRGEHRELLDLQIAAKSDVHELAAKLFPGKTVSALIGA